MTDKLREAAQELINAMENPETCSWAEDSDGVWHSACGQAWQFFDDGLEENNFKFCHGCGRKIEVTSHE